MEHTGVLQALTFLEKSKRVDLNRVVVLRTCSNKIGKYSGYFPALEAAWRVGNPHAEAALNVTYPLE
jgi:purine nucleoside permease